MAPTDSRVRERTREERLSAPGCAGDRRRSGGQRQSAPSARASTTERSRPRGRAEVDVLDHRGWVAELGCLESRGDAPGIAGIGLLVDEQPEPVTKGELVVCSGSAELVFEPGAPSDAGRALRAWRSSGARASRLLCVVAGAAQVLVGLRLRQLLWSRRAGSGRAPQKGST